MDAAYAIYFDHRRRTDVEFRKALKRDSRREARVAKDEAEAEGAQQKAAIKAAVRGACEEGFPTDVEEREAYFMNEISRGEGLSQDGQLCHATFEPPRSTDQNLCRLGSNRGSAMFLQSSQSLPSTPRPDRNLRQNGCKTHH